MTDTELQGDQSIKDSSEDKLGFDRVARELSSAIAGISSDKSFIFGLEGKWGSGKSSLLTLTQDWLAKLPEDERPRVIRFEPWLIGNRDALLSYLFTELNKAIVEIESSKGNIGPDTKEKAKKAEKALRQFAKGISKLGGVIEVAGDASGFAPAKLLGKGLTSLRNFGDRKTPKIETLKSDLVDALKGLDVKFLVTIDDVDRLDPEEVLEILRLAKSVADLPNVSYLLCYDSEILAQSVEKAGKIEDGKRYLEKIVQLSISVPNPEPFQLRNWFAKDVAEICRGKKLDAERLREVIDFEGGRQLLTPRSVKKTLDSFRFVFPNLSAVGIDLPDLIWVLLIKDGNHELYRWIERYCATAAAFSMGYASVSEEERRAELKSFLESVPKGHFDDLMYRLQFSSMLPGVEVGYTKEEEEFSLFRSVEDYERDKAIRAKRLSSPDHYRYFFAFSPPTHALLQRDIDRFWRATNSGPTAVAKLLIRWHKELVANGLSKADVLFDRLSLLRMDERSPKEIKCIILGMARSMDQIFMVRPIRGFEFYSLWGRAERVIAQLLGALDVQQRPAVVRELFKSGQAIGWLSNLVRREIVAHGVYGDSPKPETDWYFSADEFSDIQSILLSRFNKLTFEQLKRIPRPVNLLFVWKYLGDEEGPSKLLKAQFETENGFLAVLELLSGTVETSSGEADTLSGHTVAEFFEYEKALERLKVIAARPGRNGSRAQNLLRAVEEGF